MRPGTGSASGASYAESSPTVSARYAPASFKWTSPYGFHGARMASAWNRFFAARRKRGLSAKQIGVEWRKKKRGTKSRRTSRASVTRRGNPTRRKTMARSRMIVPHPSITGMAAGFSIFDDLVGGNGASVLDQALSGNVSGAITELGNNAQKLVKTDTGRKALVQAVGIAAIGAWARKALPATKIGGTKLYFRI